jgi:bacillithiol biosynthesis cysteine-adding enzyme BshC
MQKTLIHRTKTGLFSEISNELVYNQKRFSDLLTAPFNLQEFENQIHLKKQHYSSEIRKSLVESFQQTYATLPKNSKIEENIQKLAQESTFTITTGHQLNLFTGPAFFVYKILHVIRLCEEVKKAYRAYDFVPIYWMASEDHDFEEIQSTHIFGKKITWETEQKGAVGAFHAERLDEIRTQLHDFFKTNPEAEIHQIIDSYQGKTLSEATFNLVNKLFADYGLLILEPNTAVLKKWFAPMMQQEILQQETANHVAKNNRFIQKEGFKPQVHAREINLFYVSDQKRERIIKREKSIEIESRGILTEKEIVAEIAQFPERFSPNVVLRPIYQECILPNLAYVGGGGEMAYWLQFNQAFNSFNIPYPLIQVRTSIQIIDASSEKKRLKLELSHEDLFKDVEILKKEYTLKNAGDKLNLLQLHDSLNEMKTLIFQYATNIDKALDGYAQAEIARLEKQLFAFEQKLVKHQKNAFESALKQIEDLKLKLFSSGVQERSESFFTFCASGDVNTLLEEIKQQIDPFEKDFVILTHS